MLSTLDNFEAEKPRILREVSEIADGISQMYGHKFIKGADELSDRCWHAAVIVYYNEMRLAWKERETGVTLH